MSIIPAMNKFLAALLLLISAPAFAQVPLLPGETAAPTVQQQMQTQAPSPQNMPAETDAEQPKKVINQYDDKYKVKPIIVESRRGDVIPQNKVGVYFVRASDDPAEATLRLSSPLSVNGCIIVHQPPPVIAEEPPYLRVFLENPSVQLDREARLNQTSCQQAPQFLYSDIKLNRDTLMAQGINKIVLRNNLLSDTYNLDLTSERIMLVPDTQKTFKPQDTPGKSNPLEYWFYPANTIILSVPKSKDARETYELLKPLANEKNLITLGSVLPGFGQNLDQETRFYFVDETGALPKQMGDKNSMPLGEIQVTRTFTGMQGPYDVNEKLEVFAMKPGYYD